ncbi:ArsR family transcriptional regulator [Corallococcus sp. AB049A]|uniref:ArsR family transcriptional regulator n=1 Tax=Corallococcus interemptor TaxID=2316720 RepID=A0A3A8R1W8_9BACT|nr:MULTISPECIES: winged helix-turn-helix domain-containing protein [Corallococcus]RKH51306.1 ArsR family transcriptional regulator [Corallococcus sp. AB050B]RKH69284.1 ArsR family transcriptional regulator [Corallococcus interemptor]RKI52654.1 ArsR family transcriptional regulator [Corallococcus sp. AB049A]
MARRARGGSAELEALDLGHLALFVGMRVNALVLEQVHAAGFPGLRQGHGYVVQHLLEAPRTISELAELLGVTQQAASKTVAELRELGIVEPAPSDDARTRRIRLSERGHAAVDTTRDLRAELETRFRRAQGARVIDETRRVLAAVLESLGGAETVRRRRVREPR